MTVAKDSFHVNPAFEAISFHAYGLKPTLFSCDIIFTTLLLDRIGESNIDNLNCYSCYIMFFLRNIEAV